MAPDKGKQQRMAVNSPFPQRPAQGQGWWPYELPHIHPNSHFPVQHPGLCLPWPHCPVSSCTPPWAHGMAATCDPSTNSHMFLSDDVNATSS